MFKMFTRCRLLILLVVFVSLILPAPALAQRRRNTRRTVQTQTKAPATQPSPTPVQPSAAPAQTPATAPAAPAKKPDAQPAAREVAAKAEKGTWRLKVTTTQPRLINLKAEHALVDEIAQTLSRKLDVPVRLSPVMSKARVTLEFTSTPLEGALRMIAPQPYVDYEVTGDGSAPPKIVAIYLYAMNEPPPGDAEVVRGDSEALLIEGNTDDVDTESERDKQEKTLSVKVERNQVTLHAKRQPLTAVLFEIANKVDIPFEMKYDSSELVDLDLSNATMEQVVRSLSPNIRLYQRTDLQTYETRPLRIVLAPPTNTQQTTKM
jgi:hypothetical protein